MFLNVLLSTLRGDLLRSTSSSKLILLHVPPPPCPTRRAIAAVRVRWQHPDGPGTPHQRAPRRVYVRRRVEERQALLALPVTHVTALAPREPCLPHNLRESHIPISTRQQQSVAMFSICACCFSMHYTAPRPLKALPRRTQFRPPMRRRWRQLRLRGGAERAAAGP